MSAKIEMYLKIAVRYWQLSQEYLCRYDLDLDTRIHMSVVFELKCLQNRNMAFRLGMKAD